MAPERGGSLEPMQLRDGIVAVVKSDCPTCRLVAPVLAGLAATVISEDDDAGLEASYRNEIITVPTLLRVEGGRETARIEGWSRPQWEAFTGVEGLGPDLPEHRPGCGARAVDPATARELAVRFGAARLRSRRVELAEQEDEAEACFDRGWSDGLPVVPPTEGRVLAMLDGTTRAPDEVVAVVPPDLVECTVEKVAVNAVLAGCQPEYLPVVLAAVEAACTDEFNIHGLLATTYFSGPVVIVNGPIARAIGMNSGVNALGQGNRANATIGRALQLVIRNVGGGRPGEVDRATLGNPGKYTFCFAEDEEGLAVGAAVGGARLPRASTVTLFAGEGPSGIVDQLSRTPDSLARSLAAGLRGVAHPKLAIGFDAVLVVSPEHARVPRGGLVQGPAAQGAPRAPDRARLGARPGRRRVRRGAAGFPGRCRRHQVPARRPADRPRGRARRAVLGDHRRLDQRRAGANPVTLGEVRPGVRGVLLDPTGERRPARRERVARPPSLEGRTVALLDISKARGDVFLDRLDELLTERGLRVVRFASPRSPSRRRSTCATRSRRSATWSSRRWPIEAAARRAVCTTSPISKAGLPGVFVASTEFVDAAEAQAEALGFDTARVRRPPHPGPHRRRDAGAGRQRSTRSSGR